MKKGVLCNNAHSGYEGTFGNPTEAALLSVALQSGMEDIRLKYPKLDEIPFDSKTKWMSVRCNYEGHPKYFIKGAVETILDKCKSFYHPIQNKFEILDAYNKLASSGLRILALATGDDLNQLMFVGLGI